jgi:hypothetical protein
MASSIPTLRVFSWGCPGEGAGAPGAGWQAERRSKPRIKRLRTVRLRDVIG